MYTDVSFAILEYYLLNEKQFFHCSASTTTKHVPATNVKLVDIPTRNGELNSTPLATATIARLRNINPLVRMPELSINWVICGDVSYKNVNPF
jgi:hypothetical protein